MANTTESVALPTAADIEAGRRRLAGVAVRTPLIIAGARARPARACSSKPRPCSARLVQVPRRLQQALLDPGGGARRRRRRLLVRQSRAGRGAGGELLGMPATIVMPTDAPRSSASAPRLRRRSRALRSRQGGPRGHRARDRREERRDAGAALRRSSSSPARARPGARSWRICGARAGARLVVIGASAADCGRHRARAQGAVPDVNI